MSFWRQLVRHFDLNGGRAGPLPAGGPAVPVAAGVVETGGHPPAGSGDTLRGGGLPGAGGGLPVAGNVPPPGEVPPPGDVPPGGGATIGGSAPRGRGFVPGPVPSGSPSTLNTVAHYLALALGVIGKFIIEAANGGTHLSWVTVLSSAILAAVVFPYVYKKTYDPAQTGGMQYFLSFQQGFFFQTILEEVQKALV